MLALERVSVWLDEFVPEAGAFEHAVDWALHLGLPMRAIVARRPSRDAVRHGADIVLESNRLEEEADPIIRTCAATCNRLGVALDALSWQGPASTGVRALLDPAELCVFGKDLTASLKQILLRELLHNPSAPALVCPAAWQPMARMLVLYEHSDPPPAYLDAVAKVCRRFENRPVVLAIARSDSEARWRQRAAAGALAIRGVLADYDAVSGGDVRSAVAWVARWRRCTHVILAKRRASAWWRWLRGDPMEELLSLGNCLTFLAIPDTVEQPAAPAEQPVYSVIKD